MADARGCLQRSALTSHQRECTAYELLGLDVVVSADLSYCVALEVQPSPRQQETEIAMQLVRFRACSSVLSWSAHGFKIDVRVRRQGMYEIVLGLVGGQPAPGAAWLEL
eukprot:SAG11_NODE_1136_length_5731_cov_23.656250_7_plen_109_part_00